jgi:hypothetical protein
VDDVIVTDVSFVNAVIGIILAVNDDVNAVAGVKLAVAFDVNAMSFKVNSVP